MTALAEALGIRLPAVSQHLRVLKAAGLVEDRKDGYWVYYIMSQRPDTFVDITPVWEQKMRAVQTFESQGRHLPEVEPFFRRIAEQLGARAGVPMAEGFRRLVPS